MDFFEIKHVSDVWTGEQVTSYHMFRLVRHILISFYQNTSSKHSVVKQQF